MAGCRRPPKNTMLLPDTYQSGRLVSFLFPPCLESWLLLYTCVAVVECCCCCRCVVFAAVCRVFFIFFLSLRIPSLPFSGSVGEIWSRALILALTAVKKEAAPTSLSTLQQVAVCLLLPVEWRTCVYTCSSCPICFIRSLRKGKCSLVAPKVYYVAVSCCVVFQLFSSFCALIFLTPHAAGVVVVGVSAAAAFVVAGLFDDAVERPRGAPRGQSSGARSRDVWNSRSHCINLFVKPLVPPCTRCNAIRGCPKKSIVMTTPYFLFFALSASIPVIAAAALLAGPHATVDQEQEHARDGEIHREILPRFVWRSRMGRSGLRKNVH